MNDDGQWEPQVVWSIPNDHPNAPVPPPGHYAWSTDPDLRRRAPGPTRR